MLYPALAPILWSLWSRYNRYNSYTDTAYTLETLHSTTQENRTKYNKPQNSTTHNNTGKIKLTAHQKDSTTTKDKIKLLICKTIQQKNKTQQHNEP